MPGALASFSQANLGWTSEAKFLINFQAYWLQNPNIWPPEEPPIQNTINLMDWAVMG